MGVVEIMSSMHVAASAPSEPDETLDGITGPEVAQQVPFQVCEVK